ncbi:ribosome biogenesis GTPase Der [Blattabacterium cuenoti]|uniref:ribosome biogenesis GTPase Der n=1 Tax=Blattabacterium cuenoti TaxID=1653831 RepID=UPI00163B9823|nr:ribosome biogenesis GTPase Der [Blattabacterium cuenoti]
MNGTVSIIGSPNVGKSTLFNRFIGERKAIIHKSSGITRDRISGYSEWNGILFSVIDTGGFTISYNDLLKKKVNNKIFQSIKESNILLFIVDITQGLLNTDIELSNFIRKYEKLTLLVVNKIDCGGLSNNSTDFFKLGFDYYYYISAINGSGTGDLLDKITKILMNINDNKIDNQYKSIPKISIIGRPNVGKSTLINSFLNKNHHIVTDIPGTTRDSLDIFYEKLGYKCIIIDTPGIRKKSKINNDIEFYSTTRTIKTIKYVDVCLLMIDASLGWKRQEVNLFKIIETYKKGIIILVNKWDLFLKNSHIKKNYEKSICNKILSFDVPILFISAKEKYNIENIIPITFQVITSIKKKLKTNILNKIMLPIIKSNPPPSIKINNIIRFITIKYCIQLPLSPPIFIFFSNFPRKIKESYRKFIENKIRFYFNFKGVPIQIFFRKK